MSATTPAELAATLNTTTERLKDVVRRTIARIPRSRYYVFRITNPQSAAERSPDRPRMIAAFPSPDAALAFAQRNGYGSNAQLRPLATADLVLRLLAEPSISTILFLDEPIGDVEKGFGPGLKIKRDKLLEQLTPADESARPQSAPQIELSAAAYDALQFGVNFKRRAEFRVALTEVIEQVVATYEPPPGSLDSRPRSIFATGAVEQWLRERGFPHAHQRRWIDVADDPRWSGAVELCEIDAGTENHLLIQLAIHTDESGRQYIKRVNVTV